MRKLLLALLFLICCVYTYSQNENPFKEFGYDVLVATSSKGEFQEFHDQTDIVEIGSVLYNRQTKEIVKVLDKDSTTIDISSAISAMTIDPLCEKYYWISPYVYAANNPLKWVDLRGDSLTYFGEAQAAVNLHNTHLGTNLVTVNTETGLVSMPAFKDMDTSNMTQEQIAYAQALDKVVNGLDGMTSVNITVNDENVIIADAASRTFDVGDIGKFPIGNLSPINSGSVMIHEVWEQYQIQVKGASLKSAHVSASGLEGAITSSKEQIDPINRFITPTSSPKTGYMDVQTVSGSHKARVHYRNFNITGVSYFK